VIAIISWPSRRQVPAGIHVVRNGIVQCGTSPFLWHLLLYLIHCFRGPGACLSIGTSSPYMVRNQLPSKQSHICHISTSTIRYLAVCKFCFLPFLCNLIPY
jgi:hypothetical protein